MQDKIYMNKLFDFYGGLLTEKQQQILQYYFRYDLSLQEIAENENITRSAVHDMIKRGKEDLEFYESKLQLLANQNKRQKIYEKLLDLNDTRIEKLVNQCKKTEGGQYE